MRYNVIGFLFRKIFLLSVFSLVMGVLHLSSQMVDDMYLSNYQIDSDNENKLFIEFDNLSFFKNNETATIIVPGYTLPGFWLQAKAVYYPLGNIKLEAGIHSLWYWGADRYPAYTYSGLSHWKGRDSTNLLHLRPFFRVQVALSVQAHVVLGNIYGGSNHRLIEPLYNRELNLSADPETGMQVLYHTNWLDFDTWINWESFIYKSDTHQEAFTFGLSSRFKSNRPESRLHVYFPLQVLAQHRGGQIDVTNLPVQTMLNGAAGVGLDWNTSWNVLKKINTEFDLTGYYQHAGNIWPLKRGYGIYSSLSVDIAEFKVKTAYWKCDDFISMYGNPYFGALSMGEQNVYFKQPEMITLGAGYVRTFAKGFVFGADFELYHRRSSTVVEFEKGVYPFGAKTDYSFGVYLRMNPSFLLKKFE